MPHQKPFRLGWQSQNLARFLLYKFAFLAEPVQVADDIGIDYFCTIFNVLHDHACKNLIPKTSFAIQIKSESKSNKISLTKYLPYLEGMELPFFVGIIDRDNLTLKIYSGEFLPSLFAFKGLPSHLSANLCERSFIKPDYSGWMKEKSKDDYNLSFPKVAQLSVNMSDDEVEKQVNVIQNICIKISENIASYKKKEFIFQDTINQNNLLFTWTNWTPFIKNNIFYRLSEMFFHLSFLYSQGEGFKSSAIEQFLLYEKMALPFLTGK